MKILVIGHDVVTELLTMPACIPVMRETLIAVSRGDGHQPLRSKVAPPGLDGFLGLMPGYVGGGAPALGIKMLGIYPGNSTIGKDSHQGVVVLLDPATGETEAIVNATAITSVRTAAVSALATDVLARPDATELAVIGTGFQAQWHVRAIAQVRPLTAVRLIGRDETRGREVAEQLSAEIGVPVEFDADPARALRGALIVVTATTSSVPVLRTRMARARRARQRGRRLPAPRPRTRHGDGRAAPVSSSTDASPRSRSPATTCSRPPKPVSEPEHIAAELGEVLAGTAAGRDVRRRADRVRVARAGRGRPGRRTVRVRGRERHRSRFGRRVLMLLPTPAQIAAARAALAGIAIRTPLSGCPAPRAGGPAIYLKLETLQPTGSFKLRGAAAVLGSASTESVATGIVTASAGNMGQGAAWFASRLGVPCTVIVPPTAPAAKITAMEAYGATVLRVTRRPVVAGVRRPALRRRRGRLHPRVRRSDRDGRQRDDRAGDRRRSAGRDHGRRAVGRRRPDLRHRDRPGRASGAGSTATSGFRGRGGDGGPTGGRARWPANRSRSTSSRRSSMGSAPAPCWSRCSNARQALGITALVAPVDSVADAVRAADGTRARHRRGRGRDAGRGGVGSRRGRVSTDSARMTSWSAWSPAAASASTPSRRY